ncbi:unnamed protein product [Polarella glacialis]|uniref:Uncharacterized protein n=1 Tax=Polarella glacialis TaxID=89957 RepID=A0A813GLW4_POLGL|nr:unnamed protein product [Polarella glacialis]
MSRACHSWLNQTAMSIDRASAMVRASSLKFDNGDFPGALREISEAMCLNPGCMGNFLKRAIFRQHLGDHDGAAKDLSVDIQANPKGDAAFVLRAMPRLELHDFSGVLDDASEALRLQTQNTLDTLRCRAEAKRHLGDYLGAGGDASESIRLNPYKDGAAAAYCTRGLVKMD